MYYVGESGKMVDRIKQIPAKLLEFWNKYTSKQKTVIICVIATVLIALVILYVCLTRTTYEYLTSFENTSDTNELTRLLEEDSISYKLSKDGKTVYVDKDKTTDALLIMGSNDIPEKPMSWDEALKNDMSTTESVASKKQQLAFQSDLRTYLISVNGIKDANVVINKPVDDGTIFAETQESSISVVLTLTEELPAETIQGMAAYLARAVGNENTDKVTIIDTDGNLLFGGMDDGTFTGSITSVADYKEKLSQNIKKEVVELLLDYDYQDVQIGASNLKFNMDQVKEMYTEFSVAEGREEGPKSSDYNYKSKGSSGSAGVPGTDSNADETSYMIQNGGSSDTETTLEKNQYNPNKKETNTIYETGAFQPEDSTMAIVLKKYHYYNEEDMEKTGQLDGTTFDEFMEANGAIVPLTVDDQIVQLVSSTTGIDPANISVVAYEQPIFNAKVKTGTPISNYLMIILAVLIVALLIFVVFKGTAPVEVTEIEPELSVEQLLATTKENQSLDDIEFSDKSETRKMIEKFVDENPEAVAQLLRNWLSEDWG